VFFFVGESDGCRVAVTNEVAMQNPALNFADILVVFKSLPPPNVITKKKVGKGKGRGLNEFHLRKLRGLCDLVS